MNKVIFILLAAIYTTSLNGQYMEVGIMTGASNYKGELQSKAIESKEAQMAFGAFARYNFSKHFAVRLQGLYTNVSGSDSNHRANNPLRARNLSFQSSIIEASLLAEVNLFGFDVRDERGSSLFLFGGVGAMKFNPRAEHQGIMYDLHPLRTEGEDYKLISATFPVGLGAKIALGQKLNLSIEYGLRFTLTDYLDDVSSTYSDIEIMAGIDPVAAKLAYRAPELDPTASTNPFGLDRGDASTMDQYMILGMTLSYNLANSKKMEYDESYQW